MSILLDIENGGVCLSKDDFESGFDYDDTYEEYDYEVDYENDFNYENDYDYFDFNEDEDLYNDILYLVNSAMVLLIS